MLKLNARKLLNASTDVLKDSLEGNFIIVFDDGEVNSSHVQMIYTSYLWDLLREFPLEKLSKRFHVSSCIKEYFFATKTHTELMNNIYWDIFDAYVTQPDIIKRFKNRAGFNEYLAKRAYEVTNRAYCELSLSLEQYTMTMELNDFIKAFLNKKVQDKVLNAMPLEKDISAIYDATHHLLLEDESFKEERMAFIGRCGLVSMGQLDQCIGVRGYMTDMNSETFPHPVMRNFTQGIRSLHDSAIESRSAAKSLAYSETPLEESEYFSRRGQLIGQTLTNVVEGDCGSLEYMPIVIDDKHFKHFFGKYYKLNKDDHKEPLKIFNKDCKDLIGKEVYLRSVHLCAHPEHGKVCSVCLGSLSDSVFGNFNLGQLAHTSIQSVLSQKILSVKHLDGSSVVDHIVLDEQQGKFFTTNKEGNQYFIKKNSDDKVVEIVIDAGSAHGLHDIRHSVDNDLSIVNVFRVSQIDQLALNVSKLDYTYQTAMEIGLPKRPASFTKEFLKYVKEKYWRLDDKGNFVISIEDWDHKQPIFIIPSRHFNMSEYLNTY